MFVNINPILEIKLMNLIHEINNRENNEDSNFKGKICPVSGENMM